MLDLPKGVCGRLGGFSATLGVVLNTHCDGAPKRTIHSPRGSEDLVMMVSALTQPGKE